MRTVKNEIPVFPLGTVLFPGGPLPLRIFEPRYLDMVSDCLRSERPFGVCLIRTGKEVGEPAEPHRTGTLARIADWGKDDRGILTIEAAGGGRPRAGGGASGPPHPPPGGPRRESPPIDCCSAPASPSKRNGPRFPPRTGRSPVSPAP